MRFPLCTGSTSACARADPHGGEALSLPHLRDALPSPTDPQKPCSHPHRGEALPLRPLWPAFPAQESTAAASAPETWSCYQHQSALPHSGGALAERRPRAQSLSGSQESCWPTPGFSVRFGHEGVQGPSILRNCYHLNFSLGRAGVAGPDRSASVLLVKTSFPESTLFLRRKQAGSWEEERLEAWFS